MSGAGGTREERRAAEAQTRAFEEMMRDPSNRVCADCGQVGPKWASWSIGVFLCLRCAGVHRGLGVHVSKVKALTLDKWQPEQLERMRRTGNATANRVYNACNAVLLPDADDRTRLEHIRNKYEHMLYAESRIQHGNVASNNANAVGPGDHQMYGSQLGVLSSMGFTNVSRNLTLLKTHKGNVQAVIESLLSNPESSTQTQSQTPINLAAAATANTSALFAAHLDQLDKMGFKDTAKCQRALESNDNNIEAAVNWLLANPSSPGPTPSNKAAAAAATVAPALVSVPGAQSNSPPAKPPPQRSLLEVLMSEGDPFAQHHQQQQQQQQFLQPTSNFGVVPAMQPMQHQPLISGIPPAQPSGMLSFQQQQQQAPPPVMQAAPAATAFQMPPSFSSAFVTAPVQAPAGNAMLSFAPFSQPPASNTLFNNAPLTTVMPPLQYSTAAAAAAGPAYGQAFSMQPAFQQMTPQQQQQQQQQQNFFGSFGKGSTVPDPSFKSPGSQQPPSSSSSSNPGNPRGSDGPSLI